MYRAGREQHREWSKVFIPQWMVCRILVSQKCGGLSCDQVCINNGSQDRPNFDQLLHSGRSFPPEDELVRAAGDIGTTIFHPVGTCKMGSDPQAVVSARLKVHGLENLRVIDASIMPTVTSGNTNSPTIMIAEKGAAMMLEDARG